VGKKAAVEKGRKLGAEFGSKFSISTGRRCLFSIGCGFPNTKSSRLEMTAIPREWSVVFAVGSASGRGRRGERGERTAARGWVWSDGLKRAQRAAPLRRTSSARLSAGFPLETCPWSDQGDMGEVGLAEEYCRADCSPPCSASVLNQIFIGTMIGSWDAEGKDSRVVFFPNYSHPKAKVRARSNKAELRIVSQTRQAQARRKFRRKEAGRLPFFLCRG
jgi:hypothetical protein